MMNELATWEVLEADDRFHPANPDEPSWVETLWFSFHIPERKIMGYIYPAFRPNLGLQFGGVHLCDGGAEVPWELPVYRWDTYAPMEQGLDLTNFTTRSGMGVTVLEPGKRIQLTAQGPDFTADLLFEALMQPLRSGATDGAFVGNGHLDQPGRVHGHIELRGERIPVDCLAMRDRGWGPRRDHGEVQMGYVYAVASARSAFLSVSGTGRSGRDKVISGFLMRDGVWAKLVSGTRQVVRDAQGRVASLSITALDELGRELHATGTVESRMINFTYTSMLCWCALVRWEFDGQRCWGEDQDCWPPRRWRDYAAELVVG